MEISDLLIPKLIELNLEAKTKNDALRELVNLLAAEDKITSKEEFYQVILDREEKSTTGVGNGVAIPHGKSEVVKEPALVFAKTEEGIEFDSLDEQPAKIFFMIAVPKTGTDDHLKILAQLSRKLMHDDFRQDLLAAQSKKEILSVIDEHE
ncbi:PTS sugar transporter subunit IIA [Sporohalobacter salinus]|uniref:PTS sugar transporter subunit IIA n=1 Tax=Sporohalobacter salinus TaxID=1494606 RepID=UPI00195F51C3|nr:PTS sugar transporter subunit IIA [Sporohalobacter salinus]MBM7624170.1 fructose-specific phosphotransferase system IIA component [Sporohalobacter salinus]